MRDLLSTELIYSRRNAIILLSRILVPPSSSSQARPDLNKDRPPAGEPQQPPEAVGGGHHPSETDAELITGVIGGVLDLLKVRSYPYH